MAETALAKEPRLFEPFSFMKRFSEDVDRMFRRGWLDEWRVPRTSAWMPDLEMLTRNNELVVRADLPGLTEKDVSVEVANDVLTIKGERKQEKEVKEADYYTCERSYGSFARFVALPEGVKSTDAKAIFKNGVLEVVMPFPKAVEREARKLEISTK